MWFKGVYSTARVVAVRQLICGKRGRSLGTCRAEGAKYFLPIAVYRMSGVQSETAVAPKNIVLVFTDLCFAYKVKFHLNKKLS